MKQNKQMLNEVRRMQQLAGIKPIVEMEDMDGADMEEVSDMDEAGGFDMDQAVAEGMGGESYAAMSQDRGDTGSSIEFTVTNDMGDKAEIEYTITPNSQARPRIGSRLGAGSREPQSGMAMVAKQDWITVNGTSFGPIKWH